MNEVLFFTALATFIGGALAGLAALRRSGKEADKSQAEATVAIMGASSEVVKQLREQMAEMNERMGHLEDAFDSWEQWADRALALIDRALTMLGEEKSENLRRDVKDIKRTKLVRHYHRSTEKDESRGT